MLYFVYYATSCHSRYTARDEDDLSQSVVVDFSAETLPRWVDSWPIDTPCELIASVIGSSAAVNGADIVVSALYTHTPCYCCGSRLFLRSYFFNYSTCTPKLALACFPAKTSNFLTHCDEWSQLAFDLYVSVQYNTTQAQFLLVRNCRT